jgi:hypothetical protein
VSVIPVNCRAEYKAKAAVLVLPGQSAPFFREVAEQVAPDESNLEFPALVLTEAGVTETSEGGLNNTEDVGYPTRFMVCDRQDRYDHSVLPDYDTVRFLLVQTFSGLPLDTVPESLYCRVEYDTIIDPNTPQFQYLVSQFVVRAVCRVPRPGF